MARTEEASGTVVVSRRQLVTFTGRTLASVELTDHGLVVTKKRERGGRYDSHTFPLVHVVAFVEGEGGRREPAYATVMTHVVVKKVSGEISYDQGWTVVTDADGNEHRFRAISDAELVVIEDAEKPERAGRAAKGKKKPATKTRRKPSEDEDDGEDLGEDDGDDADPDEEGEDDGEDGEDVDIDEEGDSDPDEDGDEEDSVDPDDEEDEPEVRTKKPASKPKPSAKGKGKPASKVTSAKDKPGRRYSSF